MASLVKDKSNDPFRSYLYNDTSGFIREWYAKGTKANIQSRFLHKGKSVKVPRKQLIGPYGYDPYAIKYDVNSPKTPNSENLSSPKGTNSSNNPSPANKNRRNAKSPTRSQSSSHSRSHSRSRSRSRSRTRSRGSNHSQHRDHQHHQRHTSNFRSRSHSRSSNKSQQRRSRSHGRTPSKHSLQSPFSNGRAANNNAIDHLNFSTNSIQNPDNTLNLTQTSPKSPVYILMRSGRGLSVEEKTKINRELNNSRKTFNQANYRRHSQDYGDFSITQKI